MTMRSDLQKKTYQLLSIIVCAALFQAIAAAQNKPSSQTTATTDSAARDSESSASAISAPRESCEIELLKAQLALHQKRIEQLGVS